MALTKISNNSLSAISSLPASIPTGSLTLISTQTASSSASIEFTSGIDSTYDSYVFKFIDIHPATDITQFSFNMSTDGGSNYNVTKTSSSFRTYHSEDDSESDLSYFTNMDLAQSTSFQPLTYYSGDQNDGCSVGTLQIFNPSSTTFVKHFICIINEMSRGGESTSAGGNPPLSHNYYVAGYGNTTSAINAIKFQMSSGNIDAGVIKLYGVS